MFIKTIKKKKSINLKNKTKISSILNSGLLKTVKVKNKDYSKYNLIIVCTGSFLNSEQGLIESKFFIRSYNEFSITAFLKHSFCKNNIARQIFLDNEIVALLPISNTETSVVWSIKKNLSKKYKNFNGEFLKKKLNFIQKIF